MTLYLEIDASESFEFFKFFDNLSPLRKKIWNKLVEKATQWTIVCPSQTTIAMWCHCSRSAINEALSLFKKYGWLWLRSRGWKKSKIVEIPTSLKQIDVRNKSYFHRVRATYRATHTSITKEIYTGKETGSSSEEFSVPFHIDRLGISLKTKLKLSLVPENIYNNALETAKAKHAKTPFESPDKIEFYVAGTAIHMAKKKGIYLNWKGYYEAIKKFGIAA